MSKAHLLDTSAIFALTDNEDGADVVEEFLDRAKKGQISLQILLKNPLTIFFFS